MGSQKKQGQLR